MSAHPSPKPLLFPQSRLCANGFPGTASVTPVTRDYFGTDETDEYAAAPRWHWNLPWANAVLVSQSRRYAASAGQFGPIAPVARYGAYIVFGLLDGLQVSYRRLCKFVDHVLEPVPCLLRICM